MPFRTPIKVCFADIDNAGIVYYPRFIHYFHLAMEEFFTGEVGIDYADILHERNLSLPTVHLESDFRRRLRYGDHINMAWGYKGYRINGREEIVVEGQNVTVCVKTDTFEKIEVPGWLKEALTNYMERFYAK